MKLQYLFLMVFLFSMCQENNQKKVTTENNDTAKVQKSNPDCKYKPEPIFDPEWEKVSQHSFERAGERATEKVTFQNEVRLELFQTICNDTQQEYHFILKGSYQKKPDEFWIAEAANQFFYMAGVGEKVQGIAGWGLVIEKDPSNYVLGETTFIQDGITMKIDKLVRTQESEVIITTAQKAS